MNVFEKIPATMQGAVHTLGANNAQWAKNAKLDWEIVEAPAMFKHDGKSYEFKGRKCLVRSDDLTPLSYVSTKYKPVQPKAMLDFFGEIADTYGFKLALAGEVTHGRKIWALAETPHEMSAATKGDKVGGYFMFMTGCDGGLSTQGMFTSMRFFCANQLPLPASIYTGAQLSSMAVDQKAMALMSNARSSATRIFKITHSTAFDPKKVQKELEMMNAQWSGFEKMVKQLVKQTVTQEEAVRYFLNLFYKKPKSGEDAVKLEDLNENHTVVKVLKTYESGVGQKGITGTAWGLVNAVTRHLDHETKAKDPSTRIRSAWIEDGMRLKTRALANAAALVR